MQRRRASILLACVAAFAAASGCDESFEPIMPSDLQFSIYGYLDPAADTQWIRVTPLRPIQVTAPDSFDAVVTLEEIRSGRTIVLRDSLFRFSNHLHPELGSEGVFVHNFWTTEPIEPGRSYHFTAMLDGGDPAEAAVHVPEEYGVELWLSQNPQWYSDYLRLSGVNHIPFVILVAHYFDGCREGVEYNSVRPMIVAGDVQDVPVERVPVPPRGFDVCGAPQVEKWELQVIGADTAWPRSAANSPSSLIPQGASNVTNAVGFVGGALSRLVPYEHCEFQGPGTVPTHCGLVYDDDAARISGVVSESRCGEGPIEAVRVTMTELVGEPAAHRKVRKDITTRAGEYEIGALVPGMPYALTLRAKPDTVPFVGEVETHSLYTDTVTFEPGEDRELSVGLAKVDRC